MRAPTWRRGFAAALVVILCSGIARALEDGSGDPGDASGLASPATPPQGGEISGTIRINHFGWRPGDRKIAVISGREKLVVELRRVGDPSPVRTYVSGGLRRDEDSGDSYSTVDLTDLRKPGTYFLSLPDQHLRSYDFEINEHVYNVVGAAAAKSFYFQRCNHTRELPYASDALPGSRSIGGQWVDGQCHPNDFTVPAGPGSPDHGRLDLHGGWHDAGDYQKTLWDRGVGAMLWAYEIHPAAWWDGQLNIPESGNGVPDLLDEITWELDFYLRMQRPDGHFMTSVKGKPNRVSSPPSSSDERRVYFDSTSPAGNGWSGGGVTIDEATANAVLALAHAAIVFRHARQAEQAQRYERAALLGFAWLAANQPSWTTTSHTWLAAAAAVFRLQPNNAVARALISRFDWTTWDGSLDGATPGERIITQAAWHCLANPAADERLKTTIGGALRVLADEVFAEAGAYGGLYGGPDNGWDWAWGSNRTQSVYGANLLMAAHFGVTAERTPSEVRDRAQSYFHYLLGLNPLNMVYLTNMAAYGGEHSSFQIYHDWFSQSGSRGERGNPIYNGKPKGVFEPLYPYYPDDHQVSTYGPAPGLMPGGPNWYYSGAYRLPNRRFPAYAYRDWSVGCDWDGTRCASAAWEITEPAVGYQGWFLLLASFMMSASR